MQKEPFRVTVKDELELNIQKYEKLSSVIGQKSTNINEVLEYGNQLADRAKTKQEFYRDGVTHLTDEWTRVTALVEERKSKLSEWSGNLAKYEETYGGTVRNIDDFTSEVALLEATVLEGNWMQICENW